MTMRFGGHIATAACLVFFAGAVAAQTQNPTPQQTPGAEPGTPRTRPDQQDQAPPDQQDKAKTDQSGAKNGQQGQKQPPNSSDKNGDKKKTPVDEFEQKIRDYDPLANDNQQPQAEGGKGSSSRGKGSSSKGAEGSSSKGTDGSTATVPSRGDEPAGIALPGPAVGGDVDTGNLSGYAGPAVLSRSYTLLRPLIPTQERWIPIIGVNGIYDSGLNGVRVAPNGAPVSGGSEGAELFWGISGRRYFHRDAIGVDYRGDMQYYSPAKYYDGSNHWLTVDYSHAFSRHLSTTLVETGSVYSQNYTLENPVAVSNESVASINLSTTPNIQIFDNGLQQLTTSADVTWRQSARLSFDAGGSWFGVHRNANYLLGATGYQGRADGLYRWTRRMTIGVSYGYNTYSFSRGAGGSTFNTVDAIYSWAISSSLQLLARGGISRLNSWGLTSLLLPPSVASVVGQNTVIAGYRSNQWVTDFSAQLIKDFRHGRSGSVSFARGITPGNGLFLTSIFQTATASGSLLLRRRYYASFGAGYDSLSAASQIIGSYGDYFAFAGVSRGLKHGVQANFRFDYRHFTINNQPVLSNVYRVSLGFSWSPSEDLLRLW